MTKLKIDADLVQAEADVTVGTGGQPGKYTRAMSAAAALGGNPRADDDDAKVDVLPEIAAPASPNELATPPRLASGRPRVAHDYVNGGLYVIVTADMPVFLIVEDSGLELQFKHDATVGAFPISGTARVVRRAPAPVLVGLDELEAIAEFSGED